MNTEAKIKLTEQEKMVLDNTVNYDTAEAQRGDNYSNLACDKEDAKSLGLSIHSLRGIVGSLVKKGIVYLDDIMDDGTEFIYLTELGIEVYYK